MSVRVMNQSDQLVEILIKNSVTYMEQASIDIVDLICAIFTH